MFVFGVCYEGAVVNVCSSVSNNDPVTFAVGGGFVPFGA
jgi:hypothetical protein